MEQRHTYDMGVVGNCAYLAYVDSQARVVWLCFPRFDSGSVFGRLLDPHRGGEFSIYGIDEEQHGRQSYIRNTNVLETEVTTSEGVFRVTDCAPRFRHHERIYKPLMLIRQIVPLQGNPRIKIVCRPRGDYGSIAPHVYAGSNHLRYVVGSQPLRLYGSIPLSYIESELYFVLNEPKFLILTWGFPLEAPLESTADLQVQETVSYWESWVRRCSIGRFYQKEVIRSALVLKLHQYEDTGAIIASGTTSLPETPSTERTWDYRYCWIRDAYYTLNVFSRISQFEEMQRFAHFVENVAATAAAGRYPPVVKIDGTFDIPEKLLDLQGYAGGRPVRIGNQASSHIQNDIYGQILFALLQQYIDERFPRELRTTSKQLVMTMLAKIEATLGQPDATLWEFRNFAQRHCYTSLFHWVGSKAAAKIARHLGDRQMSRLATRLIARSARCVEECYNPTLEAYTQEPGSSNMDASLLQLISLHFLDPLSDRARKHLRAIEKQLKTPDGLIYRYRHDDDFGHPRSTFLVCAFWYVEALAAMGQIDDALKLLEVYLKYANPLGLLSEDIDAATGDQWGNFPQTYSHVGLMNAVFRITAKVDYPDFF